MSLPFSLHGYEKSLCYACLPILVLLDHLHEQQHAAIVIVVTPLTAIMEEQVRPSITSMLPVYHLGLLITTKQATRDAEKSMKEYEANTDTCRRDYLFSDTDNNMSRSMTSPRLLQVVSAVIYADGYSTLILLFNLQVLKAGLK